MLSDGMDVSHVKNSQVPAPFINRNDQEVMLSEGRRINSTESKSDSFGENSESEATVAFGDVETVYSESIGSDEDDD